MTPDLERAAVKAVETLMKFHINPTNIDPIPVLEKLPNVLLILYDAEMPYSFGDNQDAFTLVNNKDGKLQYIIIYNKNIDSFQCRIALSRELGHVILEHDGSSPESVWMEEASCFAHHFLCPLQLIYPIRRVFYRPIRMSISLEMKESMVFDSIDAMKAHVVSEQNKVRKYIGSSNRFAPGDIQLNQYKTYDDIVGWKNCFDIVLDGKTIGYCGE